MWVKSNSKGRPEFRDGFQINITDRWDEYRDTKHIAHTLEASNLHAII